MRCNIFSIIALSFVLAGLLCHTTSVCADESKRQNDAKEIRAAFNRFWYGVRTTNWRLMESSAHFPFTQMNVRFSDRVLIMHNRKEFEADFMNIRTWIDRGYKAELQQYHGDFVISQMQIIEDRVGLANVNLQFRWGEKTPFKLVTSLRKYNNAWKVVFTQIPA